MKVLIADDQAEVRSALKVLFEHISGGYDIDEANEVEAMLHKTEYNQPDMILMDWELSNRPMAAFVPILRRLARGMAIIALSGRPEASKEASEAGVDAFVSKGEGPGRLLDVINRARIEADKKAAEEKQPAGD